MATSSEDDENTECATDLDSRNKMIIFEFILTTFEASIISKDAGVVLKVGSSLKPNQHNQVFLSKSVKC